MHRKIKKSIISFGMLLFAYVPINEVQGQNVFSENADIGSLIESEIIEDYHKTTYQASDNTRMRDIDGLRTDNKDSFEWLLDTYNDGISEGDEIAFIETEKDGISYPLSARINYSDETKDDLLLLGEAEYLGYAIRVNYHNSDGDHVRSLWINKRNPNLFDIVSHDIEFPIEGYFEDNQRRISSGFGPRSNPLTGAYGGPSMNYHNGIDIPLPEGTEIYLPLEGRVRAGYSGRREGTNGYNTFMHLGKTLESISYRVRRNSNRRAQRERIDFQFFHLSDYPEDLKTESAEALADRYNIRGNNRQEYVDWYEWIMSSDDEATIYSNLQNHGWHRIFFPWVDAERDSLVGYTGNTGMSTGNHIHIGVKVNDEFVDPEEFFGRYGVRRGWSEVETQENFGIYDHIKNTIRSQ